MALNDLNIYLRGDTLMKLAKFGQTDFSVNPPIPKG